MIKPGRRGVFKLMDLVFDKLVPQLLDDVTETTPAVVKPLLKVIVAMLVPCPAVTLAPAGAVQV